MLRAWLMLAVACGLAGPALAIDRYEATAGVGIGGGDDGPAPSYVELLHGQIQVHDLEDTGAADADWPFVHELVGHSYEAIVTNSSLRFAAVPTAGFATMNRVDALDTLLTAGAPVDTYEGAFAVRWIGGTAKGGLSFIKVVGQTGFTSAAVYDLVARDTTYSVPRWNNTASQLTVFQIRNTRTVAVTGEIYFYDAGGALLHTEPLFIPANGLTVLNTSALSPLSGLSGSAAIAHLGGYGALAGKAVALEPSTGFTFDTPFTPIPY